MRKTVRSSSSPARHMRIVERVKMSRLILDPSCGEKNWLRGNLDRFITCDILQSVRPDVVGDMKRLPFASGVFDAVRFDPPHMLRKDFDKWKDHGGAKYIKYGCWRTRREWETALVAVNDEFHRVTRVGSTLLVKIIDGRNKNVTKAFDLMYFDRPNGGRWNQIKQYIGL